MKRANVWLLGLAAILLGVSPSHAAIDIGIPHVTVGENVTSVDIGVYGSGADLADSLLIALQVGDGGTVTGNTAVPVVSAISFAGSVWESAPSGFDIFTGAFPPPDEVPTYGVILKEGNELVSADGLLFTMTLDLTGFSVLGNSWSIALVTAFDDRTQISGGGADLTGTLSSGSITIIPEPATVALLAAGVGIAAVRRRRIA